jgi:hypothetical protein
MSGTLDARFARHFSLAEIGTRGQARIAQSAVCAGTGDRDAIEVALTFLARAGMRVGAEGAPIGVPSTDEIARAAGRPELVEAATFLAGALAATARLGAVVGVRAATPVLPRLSEPIARSERP